MSDCYIATSDYFALVDFVMNMTQDGLLCLNLELLVLASGVILCVDININSHIVCSCYFNESRIL